MSNMQWLVLHCIFVRLCKEFNREIGAMALLIDVQYVMFNMLLPI